MWDVISQINVLLLQSIVDLITNNVACGASTEILI